MFRVRPARDPGRASRRRSSALVAADDETGSRARGARRRLGGARGGRSRAGSGRASFGHDGHNLMRYRPDAVSAAILSVAGETGRLARRRVAMQVVYTPAHLGHDITIETYMGVAVPANEVAERAERIRVDARGRRRLPVRRADRARRGPDHRRPRPGPRRVSSRSPGPSSGRRASTAPFLSADTYPNRAMFEGMSRRGGRAARPRARHAGGRAGFWGLDSAAPLVAGTYVAARARRRRRADHGRPRPRAARRPRTACAGRPAITRRARCTAATASSTTPRSPPRRSSGRPASASRSSTSTTTTATARQQIFWRRGDVRYVSIHADPDRQYPYFLGRADETGEGDGRRGEPEHPAPGRARPTTTYLAATDRALEAIAAVPGSVDRGLARLRHVRARPDRRLRADDRRLPRDRPADRRARPAPGHPPGGRLPPAVARRERPGVAARRGGPAVRSAAGGRLRRAWRGRRVARRGADRPSPTGR